MRVAFRLAAPCDAGCISCPGRRVAELPPKQQASELVALREQSDELCFVGGEPTRDPALSEWIVQARVARFARVGLRTNARLLARPGFAASLAAAGLTDILVPLLGPTSACHDYHVARPGRFAATMTGLSLSIAAGLGVAISTTITRSNFRMLASFAPLLVATQASAWLLTLPRDIDEADGAFARIVPRLALALPYALHALDRARVLGLPAWIQAAPVCRLGPFASRSLPARARAYGAKCQGCSARRECPGVADSYLRRYGEQELEPSAPAGAARRAATFSLGANRASDALAEDGRSCTHWAANLLAVDEDGCSLG